MQPAAVGYDALVLGVEEIAFEGLHVGNSPDVARGLSPRLQLVGDQHPGDAAGLIVQVLDIQFAAADHHLVAGQQRQRELPALQVLRSEEHTSELQSLMRISYAVFCLKKKKNHKTTTKKHKKQY